MGPNSYKNYALCHNCPHETEGTRSSVSALCKARVTHLQTVKSIYVLSKSIPVSCRTAAMPSAVTTNFSGLGMGTQLPVRFQKSIVYKSHPARLGQVLQKPHDDSSLLPFFLPLARLLSTPTHFATPPPTVFPSCHPHSLGAP